MRMAEPGRRSAEATPPAAAGPVLPQLARLAAPIVLASMVQTSHQLINTFWVGRLGAEAVAAVSASFPVIFLVISLGSGLSIAGSILAAQYTGARDTAMISRVAGQTLTVTAVIALVLTAAGLWSAPKLLRLMGIAPPVFDAAVSYLRIAFSGIVLVFGFSMYESLMRAVGDAKRPMYLVGCGVLINVVLDPLLIFGWGPVPALGVPGAACATLIAQSVCAGVGLRLLFSARFGLQLAARDLVPDRALIARVVRLGIPASLTQAIQALSISTVTALVAGFGTLALAAYGIGFRVLTFTIIPALGISIAASIMVGQSIGAGDIARAERVSRVAVTLSVALFCCASVVVALGAAGIVRVFAPDDPALVDAGAEVLHWMALSFVFSGVQLALSGTFRGAGDTLATMLLSAAGAWLVLLPLATVLARHTALGVTGIWIAYPSAGAVNTLIALLYYRYGRWRRLRLTAERRLGSQVDAEVAIEEGAG